MRSMMLALAQESEAWQAAGTVRALAGIILVVGLVALLGWLVRRGTLQFPGQKGRGPLRIETVLALGERRSLVVVAVEGRRLLLGSTPTQVSLVTELDAASQRFGQAVDRSLSAP